VTLVLKHLVYPGGEEPVLVGCLCQGEGAALFGKKLTDWFYREGLYFCKKASVTPESLRRQMQVQLQVWLQAQREGRGAQENTLLTGAVLLCVGEYFALWSSIGQPVYLLNTRFGRSHIRLLTDGKQEQFLCGKLQNGVGIFVPSSGVSQQMRAEELAECLAVKALTGEERLEKRLRELGEKAATRGAEQVSTMLVVTC